MKHASKGLPTHAMTLFCVACVLAPIGCGFDEAVLFDRDRSEAGPPTDANDDGAALDPHAGIAIITGQYHSCLLLDGRLSCWGQNDRGQLGVGDTTNRLTAVPVAPDRVFAEVCGGGSHGCALEATTGVVLCWGSNDRGQIGDPSLVASTLPRVVPLPIAAISIACGYEHACAVLEDGSLRCWGSNAEGQLGRGTSTTSEPIPQPITGGTGDWVRVGGGQGHTCAIRSDGSLWCWGRNESGECGQPSEPPGDRRVLPMRVGAGFDWVRVVPAQNATCGLRSDDSLWCWGNNEFGNLGFPPPTGSTTPLRVGGPASWSALADETFHGAAIQRDGTLWTWGRNVEGQLGLGDVVDRALPTKVTATTRFLAVATGRFHTCALQADRQVSCAGANESGQLGTGDVDRRDVLSLTTR